MDPETIYITWTGQFENVWSIGALTVAGAGVAVESELNDVSELWEDQTQLLFGDVARQLTNKQTPTTRRIVHVRRPWQPPPAAATGAQSFRIPVRSNRNVK